MKVYIEPRDWWVGYYRGDEHPLRLPAAVRGDPLDAQGVCCSPGRKPHEL